MTLRENRNEGVLLEHDTRALDERLQGQDTRKRDY